MILEPIGADKGCDDGEKGCQVNGAGGDALVTAVAMAVTVAVGWVVVGLFRTDGFQGVLEVMADQIKAAKHEEYAHGEASEDL